MDIEQKLPNKPSFGLVVALAGVTVVVIFILALVFLEIDNGHVTFKHQHAHPTSELVMPGSNGYLESAA